MTSHESEKRLGRFLLPLSSFWYVNNSILSNRIGASFVFKNSVYFLLSYLRSGFSDFQRFMGRQEGGGGGVSNDVTVTRSPSSKH